MMITAREGIGHFAIIHNGCNMTNVILIEQHRKTRRFTMPDRPEYEETIPTDFGGLNERRYYTAEGMRTGMLLVIAGALIMTLALVVIISTLGG